MHSLIIIGDSLSQPRPWEQLLLRHTYAWKLQARHRHELAVVNFGAGSNNTAKQRRNVAAVLEGADAAYVIIQLGIVDCAPRLMSSLERLIIGAASRVPLLRPVNAAYVRLKSRHRYTLTRLFPQVQVPPEPFDEHLRAIVDFAIVNNPVQRLFLLTIAAPGASLRDKSYGILANIERYNKIIRRIAEERQPVVRVIDVFALTATNPDFVALDGYHVLEPVHEWIAQQVSAEIEAGNAARG